MIQGTAEVRTEDIRPVENYVRVTGKVYFQILYVTASADPKPSVLEGKMPFEEMVYAEGTVLLSPECQDRVYRVRSPFPEIKPPGDGGDGSREGEPEGRGDYGRY